VLNVQRDAAMQQAIDTVYASRHQAQPYRQARQLADSQPMAVLVQRLIPAECAGVCFSVDPVGQRRDLIAINAAWGLGPGVVDGVAPADTYWLRRRDFALEKQAIVEKMTQIALDPAGGTRPIAVDEDRRRAACLPEPWRQRVAEFALAAELLLGYPQDVEWAIAEGQLWPLQSRPITALPPEIAQASSFPVAWADGDESRHLWTLVAHSRAEAPLLPLEQDYLVVWESVREETCHFLGAERNGVMKMWNGRAYFRSIPLALTPADRRVRQAAQQDLKERLQQQGLTSWDYWGPEVVKAIERLRAVDLATAGGPLLAEHLENALAVLRRNAFLHPQLWFKPPQPFFRAFEAVSGLSGQEAETAAYQLLDGEENVLSRLVDGLYTLACAARQEPVVAALIADPPSEVMSQLVALPQASAFLFQLEAFLAVYGERIGDGYGSEMTIVTPTWREEPARLLRLVAAYLDANRTAPAISRARARQERDARVEVLCQACEDKTAVAEFRRQLAYARRAMVVLEEHNHWIEQVSAGLLRQAIMAAARWLVFRGVLATADEVFWLSFAEILAALCADKAEPFTSAIATRQTQYAAWTSVEPPPILGLPLANLPPRPPLSDEVTAEAAEEDGHLSGLGASLGTYYGPARVVAKGSPQPDLAPGDVLIAENAGPLWTPFFPILGGLVLESGSLGQHAAATAREYGIPAVIGCRNATGRIADGAWVTVDGTAGTVDSEFHARPQRADRAGRALSRSRLEPGRRP
jgi:pyruvate,water dikinase